MFDIGWTEMMVIACVAIVVIGPKDLPAMLRTFGKAIGNVRRLAGDFQRQFNDAIRETELDDVAKTVTENKSINPMADAQKAMADFQETMQDHIALKKKENAGDNSASKSDVQNQAATTPSKPAQKAGSKSTTAKKPATATKKPAAKERKTTAARKPVARTKASKPRTRVATKTVKPRQTKSRAKQEGA